MATDVTPTSATSPKLLKKNSLADIRYPFSSTQRAYGCGKSQLVYLTFSSSSRRVAHIRIDHVKARLEDKQEETIKKYGDIIQAIQKPNSTIPHLSPTLELMPTYLCFDCTHIAAYEERDAHDKEHNICTVATRSCS